MKCDVECLKNLELPALPSKNDNTGRLMFDLFDKHKKEYNTVELQLALEVGYTITKNIVLTNGKDKKVFLRNRLNIFIR